MRIIKIQLYNMREDIDPKKWVTKRRIIFREFEKESKPGVRTAVTKKVIVELRTPFGFSMESIRATDVATVSGFEMDFEYKPVPINPPAEIVKSLTAANEETILVRGELDESKEIELKSLPNVVNIWTDARIETFGIDCEYTIPKGTIEDVAKYLGCDQLWAKGVKGKGIVIGICDTGVDKSKVSAVIDGFSSNSMYPPGTDPWRT